MTTHAAGHGPTTAPRVRWVRTLGEIGVAAALGAAAWALPVVVAGDVASWNDVVEKARLGPTVAAMAVLGLVLQPFFRTPGWLTGLATSFLLIAVSLIDGVRNPGSHNLMPFELAIYVAMSIPAVVTASVVDLVRRRRAAGA